MKPRLALLAAILSGTLAVALVAADLAFNVDVTLESRIGTGPYRVVASTTPASRPDDLGAYQCGDAYRLTVHNGLPWTKTLHVMVWGFGAGVVAEQNWTLGVGEQRSFEFQAPNATFGTPSEPVTQHSFFVVWINGQSGSLGSGGACPLGPKGVPA
jgi:hypothetical protein